MTSQLRQRLGNRRKRIKVDIIQVGWNSKHVRILATQTNWIEMKPRLGQAESGETHTSSSSLAARQMLANPVYRARRQSKFTLGSGRPGDRRMNSRIGRA